MNGRVPQNQSRGSCGWAPRAGEDPEARGGVARGPLGGEAGLHPRAVLPQLRDLRAGGRLLSV